MAIGFRDSGGKLLTASMYMSNTLYAMHWTSSTVFSATVATTYLFGAFNPLWLRAIYDGTNVKLYYSMTGAIWTLLLSETLTTFLASGTPNFFFGADCIGGDITVDLLSYVETALP